MKKHLFFFVFAALALSAAMLSPQGLSAQKRVVKVQGYPHELLTRQAAEGKLRTAARAPQVDTSYINPKDVGCWIDQPGLNTKFAIDSAYLMIKWSDGKRTIDSLLIWGYRWNPLSTYGDSVARHGIDMLRTVANNDERLTVLLQYSGISGYTVGGIGMNLYDDGTVCSRLQLDFNIADAQREGYVDFVYFGSTPDCADGQVAVPLDPNSRTSFAATESQHTGILVHPFGVEYGFPAEDPDYWYYAGYIPDVRHWQAGWAKNGFWGYFRADNRRVPIPSADFDNDPDAAQFGVSYEPLKNQQVHGFVFEPAFVVHYFDGAMRFMDCGCAPCPTNN